MKSERLFDRRNLKGISFDGLVSWWDGSRDANRLRHRVLAVSLVLVCLAVAIVGVPPLKVFGHDIFVSLDGGWRVLHGQRPGVDFYSQMGPTYYLLHATGLWLAGGDARGLGYGSALATALISFWAFFLLRSRMKAAPFFVAGLFLALLAAAPYPLGYTLFQTSFSMKHNRYGFALAVLVMLESFLPEDFSSRKQRLLGGFSTGLACALLLFLKISYGFVALTLAAVSLLLCSRVRDRLLGLAAGFAAFGLPMMAYLRFDLRSQVYQYQLLAGVQGQRIGLRAVILSLYANWLEIALVVVMAALVSLLPGVSLRRGFILMLSVMMATVAGALLMLTNTQPSGLPLLAAAVLLLLNEISAAIPKAPVLPQAAPLLAIGLLVVGFPMCLDAAGIAVAMERKLLHGNSSYHFREAHLASISFADCPTPTFDLPCSQNDNGQNFIRYTEEGIALVQEYGRPGESVQGLGMSNPFSFATQRPPSHGGAVNLAASNISSSVMPPKTLLIGDVDLLLVPKFQATAREILAMILQSYPELLGSDYLPVAESANWVLYRRAK
jgi:predicted aconitase with swiveling domain